MRRYLYTLLLLPALLVGAGCTNSAAMTNSTTNTVSQNDQSATTPSDANAMPSTSTRAFPGILPDDQRLNKVAKIETDKGEIVIELYGDTAPKAVSNFIALIQSGFYNGLTFHRREEGFVIQGGDPNGNGTGGPGYTFEDELNDSYTYTRGTVAMANRGPNTNGSQFFIMLSDYSLPKNYTIFGTVTSGMDVVDKIQVGDKMNTVTVSDK